MDAAYPPANQSSHFLHTSLEPEAIPVPLRISCLHAAASAARNILQATNIFDGIGRSCSFFWINANPQVPGTYNPSIHGLTTSPSSESALEPWRLSFLCISVWTSSKDIQSYFKPRLRSWHYMLVFWSRRVYWRFQFKYFLILFIYSSF